MYYLKNKKIFWSCSVSFSCIQCISIQFILLFLMNAEKSKESTPSGKYMIKICMHLLFKKAMSRAWERNFPLKLYFRNETNIFLAILSSTLQKFLHYFCLQWIWHASIYLDVFILFLFIIDNANLHKIFYFLLHFNMKIKEITFNLWKRPI